MAVDLLGKMKDFWSSEAIQQLSVMLDEQPDRVGQALSLGAPTILAGLLNSVSGTTDAHHLVDQIKHEPEEMAKFGGLSGLLNHLAGLGDVAGLDPLVQYGRSVLRSIFGDKLDDVLNLITTDSGAKPSTAGALMGLLAPALMSMIRKETGAGADRREPSQPPDVPTRLDRRPLARKPRRNAGRSQSRGPRRLGRAAPGDAAVTPGAVKAAPAHQPDSSRPREDGFPWRRARRRGAFSQLVGDPADAGDLGSDGRILSASRSEPARGGIRPRGAAGDESPRRPPEQRSRGETRDRRYRPSRRNVARRDG